MKNIYKLVSIFMILILVSTGIGMATTGGTTNVNVVNTPTVKIGGMPTVDITGTSWDNPIRTFGQPYGEGCNGNGCGFSIMNPGQTYVAEYISIRAVVPNTEKSVILEMDVSTDFPGVKDQYFFAPTLVGSRKNGDNVYIGNQQIKIYVQSGKSANFEGINADGNRVGTWNVTVSGNLFNK